MPPLLCVDERLNLARGARIENFIYKLKEKQNGIKMVVKPKVIPFEESTEITVPGGGKIRRLVTPDKGCSIVYYVVWSTAEPGKALHAWHTHTHYKMEGYEVDYPVTFEETYVIVKGKGAVEWKEGEKIMRQEVKEGDAIFLPMGITEHQVLNTGNTEMLAICVGAPPIKAIK